MGRAISAISGDHGCTISYPVDLGDDPAQGIDHCDVVIDFSFYLFLNSAFLSFVFPFYWLEKSSQSDRFKIN